MNVKREANPHYLGIDLGTQGLTAIAVDSSLRVVASGEADYAMVPGLAEGCYEQAPADWESALASAMKQLRADFSAKNNSNLSIAAIGISGQMHGEVLCDREGAPIAPARLWCDGRNEAEGDELTARFDVKIPKRITAARWLWTLRNRPELAKRTAHLTTPAGWLARRLTGAWNLGIGDASGMFPIDQATLNYNQRMLDSFDKLAAASGISALAKLLPNVRCAGDDGGSLDGRGAKVLGLSGGIPVAPAEGDQPAALAGSLIGAAGTVSMSFGTSVCANSVGDRAFQGVHRAIDHFCAVDGKPINMVWLRNGTTYMNTVIGMWGRAAGQSRDSGFSQVMPQLLAAAPDCGGITALPFMDDEPGLGVARGGTAMLIGLNESNASPGNVAKASLLATVFNLRIGADILAAQGFPRSEIVLSGGLTKTPELGQIIADVFATPVTILESGSEGTAWGAALMAKYRHGVIEGERASWQAFLGNYQDRAAPRRFAPDPSRHYEAAYARYCRLLAAQAELDRAMAS